jgi:hypothetical protein
MFNLGGGRAAFLGSKNTDLPISAPPIDPYLPTAGKNSKNRIVNLKKKNSCKVEPKKRGETKIGRTLFLNLKTQIRPQ